MAGLGSRPKLKEAGAVNGQEYKQLFDLVLEARDASRAALDATQEHSTRLDALETAVTANSTDLAVGRFAARLMAVIGGSIIGFGSLLLGVWEWFTWTNGRG